jgi:hypothetical protein
MEIDIAKTFRDKLNEKFEARFGKIEEKLTSDINLLEGYK